MHVAHAAPAVEQHTHNLGHDVGVSNTTASMAGVLSFRRRKMRIGMVPLYGRRSMSANPAAAKGVLPTKRQHQPRLWWLMPYVSVLAVGFRLNAPTKQGRALGWPVDHPRGVDGQRLPLYRGLSLRVNIFVSSSITFDSLSSTSQCQTYLVFQISELRAARLSPDEVTATQPTICENPRPRS